MPYYPYYPVAEGIVGIQVRGSADCKVSNNSLQCIERSLLIRIQINSKFNFATMIITYRITRDVDPVFDQKKPDTGLCNSNEERFLKFY